MTYKIGIGTTNKLKIKAVTKAFKTFFRKNNIKSDNVEIIPKDVESGVPSAPIGDGLIIGAIQRAKKSMVKNGYGVGVESGAIDFINNKYLVETTAVAIIYKNKTCIGFGPGIIVPNSVHKLINNSKDESKRSASYESAIKTVREKIGLKTNRDSVKMYLEEQMSREDVITIGTTMALMQLNSSMY